MTTTEHAFAAWGAYDRDDPFPLYAATRALGPVHRVRLQDGHDAWLVVGYDEARVALNEARFSKDLRAALAADGTVAAEGLPGPEFARHMLVVDPPDHTRLRRLVSAAFSQQRVVALRPRIQAIVDELLDAVAAGDPGAPVDLVAAFAFPLPFTVICELLGVPPKDRERVGTDLHTLLAPAGSDDEHARAVAASESFVSCLRALVETKQAAPDDELVSALIEARDGDECLSQAELLATIFQLIVAGHDTTTSLIGNGVVALLRHPDALRELRATPERIPDAIEELLRFDAPVPHSTFRFATEPVELGGVTIPEGAQVVVCLASANRCDRHYPDADALVLDRNPRHLGFGHGIHFCLGAALARLEAELAFTALIARFPALRLALPSEDLRWSHGDGLVLRGLDVLPVIPGPEHVAA